MSRRIIYVLFSVAVIAFGFYYATKIPINTQMNSLGFEDQNSKAKYDSIQSYFPHNETMLTVLIASKKSIRNYPLFVSLDSLMSELNSLSSVQNVVFPTRFKFPFKTGPIKRSKKLIRLDNSYQFETGFDQLDEYPDIRPKFLSKDQKALAFYIYLNDLRQLDAIKSLLNNWKTKQPHFDTYLLGHDLSQQKFSARVKSDQTRLIWITLALLFIGFTVLIRNYQQVLFLFWSVGMSLSLFNLLLYSTGQELNVLTLSLPILILVLSLSDAVHLMESIAISSSWKEGLKTIAPALWLTSLTTIVGFLVFLIIGSELLANYALLAIAGLLISYCVNRFLSLPVLTYFKPKLPSGKVNSIAYPIHYPSRLTLFIFGTLFIGSVLLVSTSSFDHYLRSELEPHSEERIAYNVYRNHFESERKIELYFMSKKSMLHPEFIGQMEALEVFLINEKHCTSVYGIQTLLKRYNRYLHGGRPTYFKLISNEKKNNSLALLNHQQSLGLNAVVADEGKIMKFTVSLRDSGAKAAFDLENEIAQFLRHQLPKDINLWVGGSTSISERGMLNVMNLLLWSLVLAFVAISVVLFFSLRSIRLVLFGVIVNVFPVLFLASIISVVSGFTPTNLMILTIVLGIAVDDTIHFLKRYKKLIDQETNPIEITIRSSGKAIIKTSLLLSVGFGALLFSAFEFNRLNGLYLIIGMLAALLADIVLLPVLLNIRTKQK